jgi:hypothetical protein
MAAGGARRPRETIRLKSQPDRMHYQRRAAEGKGIRPLGYVLSRISCSALP